MRSILVLVRGLFIWSSFLNVGGIFVNYLSYKSVNLQRSFRVLLVMGMVMMTISL